MSDWQSSYARNDEDRYQYLDIPDLANEPWMRSGSYTGHSSSSAGPAENQRSLASMAHIGTIFFGVLAPLFVLLVNDGRSSFVSNQAKQAFNFSLTLFFAQIGFVILILTSSRDWSVPALIVTGAVLAALSFAGLILPLKAASAVSRGRDFYYPVAIPILS